jgi:hypothetical protein
MQRLSGMISVPQTGCIVSIPRRAESAPAFRGITEVILTAESKRGKPERNARLLLRQGYEVLILEKCPEPHLVRQKRPY